MSQYLHYIVLLGVAIQSIGIITYIRETLKGKTKPNRISWLLWSIAPLIATAAAMVKGVTWAVLPVFISGFGPLMVLIASFFNKNSYWKLGKLDYVCGLFSVLALVLWAITKEPNIAITFSILSDGLAAVPTVIKSWQYPETETATPYATGIFNALTSFLAIEQWNFAAVAFPSYLVIVDATLALLIMRKKLFRKDSE